jgi:hypothetical protein
MYANRCCNFGRLKCDQERSREDSKLSRDLTTEIQRISNVKTKEIPVIIGSTGTVSKSFRKYLISIPEMHEINKLQKTALMGTAHVLRKVLM